MQCTAYDTASFFDEMFEADCRPRAGAALLSTHLAGETKSCWHRYF
jgi:hypothetical protein